MKQIILSLFTCMSVLLAQAQEQVPEQATQQHTEKGNPLNLEPVEESVTIYPNPSNGVFTISVSNLKAHSVDLRIINVIGNEILRETLTSTDAQFSKTIDLNRYAKGLYYVKLEADDYSTVRRVVIK